MSGRILLTHGISFRLGILFCSFFGLCAVDFVLNEGRITSGVRHHFWGTVKAWKAAQAAYMRCTFPRRLTPRADVPLDSSRLTS